MLADVVRFLDALYTACYRATKWRFDFRTVCVLVVLLEGEGKQLLHTLPLVVSSHWDGTSYQP